MKRSIIEHARRIGGQCRSRKSRIRKKIIKAQFAVLLTLPSYLSFVETTW